MEAALGHPGLRAARNVYLDVWEKYDKAHRLYERYGFTVIGAHGLATASGTAHDQDLIMVRRQH
jgi:hypothetical protein